jgi:hypothetical protein
MKSNIPVLKIEPAAAADGSPDIDAEVARQVGLEILEGRYEPAAWASALAESGGRHQQAVAAYARIRMRRLEPFSQRRHAKTESLEARRLRNCLGAPAKPSVAMSVRELLRGRKPLQTLNLFKPRLSRLWLTILLLGTAGTVAGLGRLASQMMPDHVSSSLPVICLMSAVITCGVAMLLWNLLPKRWILIGWNTCMIAACNILCLGSLALGAKVISKTVRSGGVTVSYQQRITPPGKTHMPGHQRPDDSRDSSLRHVSQKH